MRREAAQAADGKTDELGLELPMTPEAIASALLGKQKIKRKRSNLYRDPLSLFQSGGCRVWQPTSKGVCRENSSAT